MIGTILSMPIFSTVPPKVVKQHAKKQFNRIKKNCVSICEALDNQSDSLRDIILVRSINDNVRYSLPVISRRKS